MLAHEGWNTIFKGLARGKKNIMVSIRNHATILEATTASRNSTDPTQWVTAPAPSTMAGYKAKHISQRRTARVARVGKNGRHGELSWEDFVKVRDQWRVDVPAFDAMYERFQRHMRKMKTRKAEWNFPQWEGPLPTQEKPWMGPLSEEEKSWQKMSRSVEYFHKADFAGAQFKTKESQLLVNNDNGHVRVDYFHQTGRDSVERRVSYATILEIFRHEITPGGRSTVVLRLQWLAPQGINPVSKNRWGRYDPDHWLQENPFQFLHSCQPRPVAVWPADPLSLLPSGHERRDWVEIIDTNARVEYLPGQDDRSVPEGL